MRQKREFFFREGVCDSMRNNRESFNNYSNEFSEDTFVEEDYGDGFEDSFNPHRIYNIRQENHNAEYESYSDNFKERNQNDEEENFFSNPFRNQQHFSGKGFDIDAEREFFNDINDKKCFSDFEANRQEGNFGGYTEIPPFNMYSGMDEMNIPNDYDRRRESNDAYLGAYNFGYCNNNRNNSCHNAYNYDNCDYNSYDYNNCDYSNYDCNYWNYDYDNYNNYYYGNYGYNYNYGYEDSWWVIIILLFFFCGGGWGFCFF